MTRGTSNTLWFLGGLAAGAVLGILYAPDSGKNTREKLRNRLSKYYDQLKGLVDEKEEKMVNGFPTSYKEQEEYRKAEELLGEVESILDELKQKPEDS